MVGAAQGRWVAYIGLIDNYRFSFSLSARYAYANRRYQSVFVLRKLINEHFDS